VSIVKKGSVRIMAETKVYIIESERGWGQRVDETKRFPSREKAEAFAVEYNLKHNNEPVVPNWYMYAKVEGR